MLLGCCHCPTDESIRSYSFSIASTVPQSCLTALGFTAVPKRYRITASPTDGTCNCDIHYFINGNDSDPIYTSCDSGGWITPPYTPPPLMDWGVGGTRPNLCGLGNVSHGAQIRWARTGASTWTLSAAYSVSSTFSHIFFKTFTSLPDPLVAHTVPFSSFGFGTAAECVPPADCVVSPV